MRSFVTAALALGLSLMATAVLAGSTEEEIARLGGPELTPIGAQRAGNACAAAAGVRAGDLPLSCRARCGGFHFAV